MRRQAGSLLKFLGDLFELVGTILHWLGCKTSARPGQAPKSDYVDVQFRRTDGQIARMPPPIPANRRPTC